MVSVKNYRIVIKIFIIFVYPTKSQTYQGEIEGKTNEDI